MEAQQGTLQIVILMEQIKWLCYRRDLAAVAGGYARTMQGINAGGGKVGLRMDSFWRLATFPAALQSLRYQVYLDAASRQKG
jgi:hypothetical protein